MEKAKVYFYDNVKDLKAGYEKFLQIIADELKTDEKIGIKIHFGADKNDTHLNPKHLVELPRIFKKPVFVETNCLYPGRRHRSDKHIELAHEHGFNFLEIDILDGDLGREYDEIEINTKNTKKAKIATGVQRYKNFVSMAHFKGHMAAGFGGALKNLGMGLAARGGKLDMHAGVAPKVLEEKCTACGLCAENCIADAITVEEHAIIDQDKCIGCAFCISVCPEVAIRPLFGNIKGIEFVEKIADYAYAGTKGTNWFYINGVVNITMKCDCMSIKQTPFMDDIGIVYSKDPVAIDKASLDLVIKHNKGVNPFQKNNTDQLRILEYAEEIGMGTTNYELIQVD